MSINYSRVHLGGSAIIGIVIALAPTVLIYKVATYVGLVLLEILVKSLIVLFKQIMLR